VLIDRLVPFFNAARFGRSGGGWGEAEASSALIQPRESQPTSAAGWWLATGGLFLFVFAVVALSGPGRIDILDGQTRYEVGRSLVEHGDSAVRAPEAWFSVFPGRDGQRYTNYRFPQSAIAALTIVVADLTGDANEPRRHFFFSLAGAVQCGLIAVLYTIWFRRLGYTNKASLAWAAAGIVCSPVWFYGTTTFDDVLGTLVTLAAVTLAFWSVRSIATAAVVGLLLGIAFNCKPPLVFFAAPALAAGWNGQRPDRRRLARWTVMLAGVGLGIAGYKLYDLYKFPPSTWAANAEAMRNGYALMWPGNVWAGLLGLTLSPGVGAIWYWPPLLLGGGGVVVWYRRGLRQRASGLPCSDQWFALSLALAATVFVTFIATMTFFAGDPNWGPRYLTPLFALVWLFVPAGAACFKRSLATALLAAALVVQVGALSAEPLRLYIERGLTSSFFLNSPWAYFRPDCSQLLARPRQIAEMVRRSGPVPERFTPAAAPTLPVTVDPAADGPLSVERYWVLSSWRPWWSSLRHLPLSERPVDLDAALRNLLGIAALGGLAMAFGLWRI
jgi:hypothetical protein